MMNAELQENHYQYVPNFIRPERARRLAQKFIDHHKEQGLDDDKQVPGSLTKYNFMPFVNLLVEKIPVVSHLIQEQVLPTCCYARIYKKGNLLKRHSDRPACEISITLNLKADGQWPIFFQAEGKKPASLILNQGDAALYLGCDTDHWRDTYDGNEYIQVFLHYVRSTGPYAYTFFDREKSPKG